MAEPTIATRMMRKYIVMTGDQAILDRFKTHTPAEWTCVSATDLDQLGEWHEVLLHRFLLLDLDEIDAFDPLDVIRILRQQYQINLGVFCFGGDEAIQDEMRIARADRFFGRDEMVERLPEFFRQYDWGE
ncbi:hypothetical protein BI364_04325 [Acidihalobacter yilgarnensis]|uniref:Response regulatory domain-containing protein n=1 Tax=Acidihalobacter yilgarnensis TaxID=2819280 RepID=A0A1D8ILI7_9GAMM|nr:hypothetical protein [Acidihalobacter yilgarnensis]AOU97320.1 hypothetical protein BI364_04325 [Acidihalobacter yilgarnensis]